MAEPSVMTDLLKPVADNSADVLGTGVSALAVMLCLLLIAIGQALIAAGRTTWRFGFDSRRLLARYGRLTRTAGAFGLLMLVARWAVSGLSPMSTAVVAVLMLAALSVTGALQDAIGGAYAQFRLRLREGDRVRVGEHEGELRSLHWDHVSLRTSEGTSIYLANRVLLRDSVEVQAIRNAVPLTLELRGLRPSELTLARDSVAVLPYRVPGTPMSVSASPDALRIQCFVWSDDARTAAEHHLRHLLAPRP